ncbi:MAG: universal stress protein [Kofleriaceae bacterium]
MFHKILCPIDFSPGYENAIAAAIAIGSRDSELVLLHVTEEPVFAVATTTPIPQSLATYQRDQARDGLERAIAVAKAAGAHRVTTKIAHGRPWEGITDALVDPSFDACVIGTHGRTGVERALIGSVAEKVLRHAPCPTLVTHLSHPPALIRHVLCPLDFSAGSTQALELADSLVPDGGVLTLLAVLDLPLYYNGPLDDEWRAMAAPSCERSLKSWAARVTRPGREVRTLSRVGYAGAQILAEIDRDPSIDLVAIGSHGRTGLERVVLGSVAEKVARHARCAVFVAHRRGLGVTVT